MKGQKLIEIGLKDYFWHEKSAVMSERLIASWIFVTRWIIAEYNKFFYWKSLQKMSILRNSEYLDSVHRQKYLQTALYTQLLQVISYYFSVSLK